MTFADLVPVANHLWQSTIFVGVVWLLSLMLRSNRASVRYWLWLAASLKFLIPFSALVAVGRLVEWRTATTIVQPNVTFLIDTIGQSLSGPVVTTVSPSVSTQPSLLAFLPFVLLTIWIGGSAMHLLAWWVRWRRVAQIVRHAIPLAPGRESMILRRVEASAGGQQVTVVSSEATLEPGIFGVLKPVLFWPRGIGSRLSDRQVEALFTHELCHVRRRDNLAAVVHMVVEAAFWFHPIVWWIERRLVDERERACDEEVVRLGGDRQAYAESILKTCEFYAESPLVCVSGVTGADLKKRVETIMNGFSVEETLTLWKRLTLAVVALAIVAAPITVGLFTTPTLQAQTPVNKPNPAFEVASVKPNVSGALRVSIQALPGGRFTAINAPLRALIRNAYQLQDFELSGGPTWLDSDRFDIAAKADGEATPEQIRLMLRTLLSERFDLQLHRETRELPIYALVLARRDGQTGPALRRSKSDCAASAPLQDVLGITPPSVPPDPDATCGVFGPAPGGRARFRGVTIQVLARFLSPPVRRPVFDRTGLTGYFDADLEMTAEFGPPPPPPGVVDQVDRSSLRSIFTAIQDGWGLKLDAERGPVDITIVDRVEQPMPD